MKLVPLDSSQFTAVDSNRVYSFQSTAVSLDQCTDCHNQSEHSNQCIVVDSFQSTVVDSNESNHAYSFQSSVVDSDQSTDFCTQAVHSNQCTTVDSNQCISVRTIIVHWSLV